MKFLFAAVSAATLLCAVPALAQEVTDKTGAYVNLGYTHIFADVYGRDTDLGALQGRLGYRFHPNFAVEAEGGLGIDSGDIDLPVIGGSDASIKVKSQIAAYAVGLLPVSDKLDLFARIGYGTQDIKLKYFGGSASDDEDSINYGLGAQYSFDGLNGIRADYTKYDFKDGEGDADTVSLSYVRRF